MTAEGSNAHFVYAEESTPFTYETPTIALPIIQESVGNTGSQPIGNTWIYKGRRVRHSSPQTKAVYGGQVRVPLTSNSLGTLLKCSTGSVSTAAGPPIVHTITPAVLSPVSFQIGWDDNTATPVPFWKDATGALAEGWTIETQADQQPTIQFDFRARNLQVSTTGSVQQAEVTPSYASLTLLEFSDLTVNLDAGGTLCFDAFTLNCRNNLYRSPAICPTNPAVAVFEDSGQQMFSGTIGRDFDDWTWYNKFVAGTTFTLQAIWNAGTNAKLQVDLVGKFLGDTAAVAGMERIKNGLPFEVESATSDAAAFTIALTNTDSSI